MLLFLVLRRSSSEKNKGKKPAKVKRDAETKINSPEKKAKKSGKSKIENTETIQESESGRPKDEVVVYQRWTLNPGKYPLKTAKF